MTAYPDDADGQALSNLASQGVDLSKPMQVDFFVDAPDEKAADAIERAMQKHGYDTEIYYDEGEPDEDDALDSDDEGFGPSWTVCAKLRMVPNYDDIVRTQSELDKIVGPLGGKADGWGTMLE